MSNLYYRGPISDHFDGDRFYNEDSVAADKNLFDVLRWSFNRKPVPWPKAVTSPTGIKPDAVVQGLRITLIGHASLLIQANGANVLLDPVWANELVPFRSQVHADTPLLRFTFRTFRPSMRSW